MPTFSMDCKDIDWERASLVFARAPLGKQRRDPGKLHRAFQASFARVFVHHDGQLIGLGRALCDGEFQAAIYDLVLLPEFQGQGIGRQMLERLREQLPVDNIILYAVPGREQFYVKCGYRRMRTAMAVLNPFMSKPEAGYLE